jgi:hypothetical protein
LAQLFSPTAAVARVGAVLAVALSLDASFAAAQTAGGSAPNLALGRPYTMTPKPNYALTTDVDDDRQLTDGVYTAWNPTWLRTSTVGWQNATSVTITIDLQSVQPIAGVSFRTSAGRAGVQWPRSLFVLVSDDNQHFHAVGDLAQIPAGTAPPPSDGYAAYRFARTDFSAHGRYVTLMVEPSGPYLFCDEIEVQAGDPSWIDLPLTGEATSNLADYFVRARQAGSISRRLAIDLAAARAAVAGSLADAGLRAVLMDELNGVEAALSGQPAVDPSEFAAVLPIGDLHARIFAVQGRLAQAAGWPDLSLWSANPWEFVRMLDKPPPDATTDLSIAAMNGETRSGAVSLSNSTGQPMKLSLHLTEPGTADIADVHLYEVAWTDTHDLIPVADALVPLPAADATIDLPAGVTRQVWISFSPRNRGAGDYQMFLDATTADGASLRAAVSLKVFATPYPDRTTLHVGGWDYTDKDGFLGLPPDTAASFIETLRDLNVNSPWATAAVMPVPGFDAVGHFVRPPDTSRFDRWISNWPGAAGYYVYLSVGDTIGNVRTSEGVRFTTAVGDWITFWVTHAASLGLRADQLSVLLVDEPVSAVQDARIAVWGRAIKAAQPQVNIWEDPNVRDPASAQFQLFDVSDELALERSLIDQLGAPFVDFYRNRSQTGQRLAVYGAAGPARLLDPYTYYRLQPWLCAWLGANTSFFWSFSDDANGHSWNEYVADRTNYSPFFISTSEITRSRHSEALREGVEDFEYLSMLRRQLDAIAERGPTALGAQAAELLQTAAADVLSAAGTSESAWTAPANRVEAELARMKIGALLERVAAATPRITIGGGDFVYDGTPHAAAATATASNGLPVDGSLTVEYVPGGATVPVHAGTYLAVATFSGDAGNTTAKAVLTVAPAAPSITVGGQAAYDGREHEADSVVSGVGGVTVAGTTTLAYSTVGGGAPTEPGVYAVVATFVSGDPDYGDASVAGSMTIEWPKVAALINPPDGATSVPALVSFEWTPVHAVDCYALSVGSSFGADDLLNTGETTATSYLADGLPRGVTLYVHLGTKVGGIWRFVDSQFSIVAPTIVRVANRSFVFDGAAHATTATATDAGGLDVAGALSLTYAPGGLTPPVAAGTYTVTATFTSADTRFDDARVIGSIVIEPALPRLILTADQVLFDGHPHEVSAAAVGIDGAPVAGAFVFAYSPGGVAPSAAGIYSVSARFTSADPNYTDAEAAATLAVAPVTPLLVVQDKTYSYDNQPHGTIAGVTGIDGRTVAGTLALTYEPGGAMLPVSPGVYTVTALFASVDSNYASVSATGTVTIQTVPLVASLTYPPDGAVDVDMSVPLQWTAVDRPDAYYLYVGTTRGAKDLVNTGETKATSYRVSNLLRGETVFVRLWTKVQGIWRFSDSTFTAARLVATLTYPSTNAAQFDLTRPLQWTRVATAQVYYVYVGTSLGSKDVVNTGEILTTSVMATQMPPNQLLYVRLWTKAGGVWRYSDSTLTASSSGDLK